MARNRNWIDYANLAANAAQVAQLHSIHGKMQQLAELEAERTSREHEEAGRARFEDSIREAIFTYGEQLRDVEDIAQSNPVAAYIRASHLKRLYAAMPQFRSSNLRNYEDKQRLANVQRASDQLIDASAHRLKQDELEASDLCLTYIFERDDLVQLIAVQEKREKLAVKKASVAKKVAPKLAALQRISSEKASLVAQHGGGAGSGLLALLGGLLLMSLVAGILVLVFGCDGDPDRFMAWSGGRAVMVAFGVLCAVGIGLLILQTGNSDACKLEQLTRRSAAIESEIAALNVEVDNIQAEINPYQLLYTQFGEATLDEYRCRLRERDTLMKHMLGTFVKGVMGEKYYDSLGDPPKKIGRWWLRDQHAESCVVPPDEKS